MFGQIRFGHEVSQSGRKLGAPQTRMAKPKGMLEDEFARIPRTLAHATDPRLGVLEESLWR